MNQRKTRSPLKKVLAAAAALVTVLPAFSGMPALNLFPQAALTASAADIVESGTCGDNLTWTLDSEGTLTISGTGPMWDYDTELFPNEDESYIPCYAPWYCGLYDKYKTVVIEPGVTSIGDWAFSNGEKLTAVQIPDSVTSIGSEAFCGCSSLTSITIPGSVTSIGSEAFFGCSSLTGISILNPECQIYSFLGRTIPTQTVIYGETGSTAEEYAQEFNRTFVPIGTIWKQNDGTLYFRNGFSADELKNYPEKLSVTRIVCEPGTKLPEDSGHLFYGYFRAESIDLSGADTSDVTRMTRMFLTAMH